MSTLRANTIQDASGGNSMPTADLNQGRARAWCNFNGTGTIAARDSFNVSSLTDNGTGNYYVNVTTAFTNSNFSAFASPRLVGTIVAGTVHMENSSTTIIPVLASTVASTPTAIDTTYMLTGAWRP